MSWFGIRSILHHTNDEVYEERIVLVQADDLDSAFSSAQNEAKTYVRSLGEGHTFTGYSDSYQIDSDKFENLSEVFSLMRSSKLEPGQYIDRYYDTGNERRVNLP